MKNIYFIADAHLGCLALQHRRTQERRLVRFLDGIKEKAEAVYMMGDMFDFWFEYKYVVPRGFTRLLGKISELTDAGIEVHFFVGNHDMWCGDYLEKECGCVVHHDCCTLELGDKVFFLGHGDGLGDPDPKFRFLRKVFRNKMCQRLLSWVHPDLTFPVALNWAKNSRLKHGIEGGDPPYLGENDEYLVKFAKEYLQTHPNINYFIFGHRHIELHLQLTQDCQMAILGDWFGQFTFATFDGERLYVENYEEGETTL